MLEAIFDDIPIGSMVDVSIHSQKEVISGKVIEVNGHFIKLESPLMCSEGTVVKYISNDYITMIKLYQ